MSRIKQTTSKTPKTSPQGRKEGVKIDFAPLIIKNGLAYGGNARVACTCKDKTPWKPCFDKGCSCRLHFESEKEYQEHCKKAKHNLINCNVKASGYHWDIPKIKKLALKVKKNEQEAQHQKELKELADLI